MARRNARTGLDKLVAMRSDPSAPPVIDNPRLGMMSDASARQGPIRGQVQLMSAEGVPPQGPDGPVMEPVPEQLEAIERPQGEQAETSVERETNTRRSVRLRLSVNRGRISVIGVHVVPGATTEPDRLDYGLAYEITDGNRLIAMGSVPDVGQRRSYPDPQRREGMEGHHLEELESFELNVRLPQKAFTARSLPRLRVTLFRMKERPEGLLVRTQPLFKQFPDQLRPIAELRGISLTEMSSSVQSQLRSAIFPSREQ
jgi:hypothetical protein